MKKLLFTLDAGLCSAGILLLACAVEGKFQALGLGMTAASALLALAINTIE